jgi:D-3-phosphoglycerate dehydrogenase|tara:strand:+ start:371 stop:1321 length:951 start_codon:yes stop_codon:yes gene_type:complete
MRILANDGISISGIEKLESNGFEVLTKSIAQDDLISYINNSKIEALLVRSTTKVKKNLIDKCPSIKLIGRGGVGMDNIDVEYAVNKGINVINTPAASSKSVAELVFAHLFGCVRHLHSSNRSMPLEGDTKFKELKKSCSKGAELRGKTLGIVGFGRIGQEVAKIAIGIGMNISVYDLNLNEALLELSFFDESTKSFQIKMDDFKNLLAQSDFITFHVPAQKKYLISEDEFKIMKQGVGIINAARGGVIDEGALEKYLNTGKVSFAALDTFENEPNPDIKILMNAKISLTPHIGAATNEAQDRIGIELADQIIKLLG